MKRSVNKEDIFETRKRLGKSAGTKGKDKGDDEGAGSAGGDDRGIRNFALATTIPFAFLAGPLVGYGIGYLLDSLFRTSFLYIVFLVLGMLASFKMTFDLVKKLSGG